MVFLVTQMVKNLPAMRETQVQSLGWEDPLEKGMVIHSSIFAWKIAWTEELGRLQSMRSQRVRHNWATKHTHTYSFPQELSWWFSGKESTCHDVGFRLGSGRFSGEGNDYPLRYSCLENSMDPRGLQSMGALPSPRPLAEPPGPPSAGIWCARGPPRASGLRVSARWGAVTVTGTEGSCGRDSKCFFKVCAWEGLLFTTEF